MEINHVHSAGPWRVQDNRDDGRGQLRVDSITEGCVAIVRGNPCGAAVYMDPTAIKDAQLIAMAPELLQAVKELMQYGVENGMLYAKWFPYYALTKQAEGKELEDE
jgi:hypothetical protein